MRMSANRHRYRIEGNVMINQSVHITYQEFFAVKSTESTYIDWMNLNTIAVVESRWSSNGVCVVLFVLCREEMISSDQIDYVSKMRICFLCLLRETILFIGWQCCYLIQRGEVLPCNLQTDNGNVHHLLLRIAMTTLHQKRDTSHNSSHLNSHPL